MNESKHTRGPWIVVTEFHRMKVRGGVGPNWPSGNTDVTPDWHEHKSGAKRGESPRYFGFRDEEIANARLIAAAPELLEALREMRVVCAACFRVIAAAGLVDAMETEFFQSGVREGFGSRAGDAIAKAEGCTNG